MPNLQIEIQALHPRPPPTRGQGLSAAGVLLRRSRTIRPLHWGIIAPALTVSLLLSAVMSPLCTGQGFFGHVNLSCAGHQRIDSSASWKALEEREVVGLIAAFARAK